MKLPETFLQEQVVLLGDVVKYLKLKKKRLFTTILVSGCAFGFLSILLPIRYEVNASFKNTSSDHENTGSGLSALNMLMGVRSARNSFGAVAKSRTILSKVISSTGIQIVTEPGSLPKRLIRRIRRNISSGYDASIAWKEQATFTHVAYEGSVKKGFFLKKKDASSFLVRDAKGVTRQGVFGEPFSIDDVTFTLTTLPGKKAHFQRYVVLPKQTLIESLRKELSVYCSKDDMNIVEIKMKDGNPQRATKILDTLMAIYKEFLEHESTRVNSEHLESLYAHKGDVEERMQKEFVEYAAALQKNADKVGFLEEEEELKYLYTQEERLVKEAAEYDELERAIETKALSSANKSRGRNEFLKEEFRLRSELERLNLTGKVRVEEQNLFVHRAEGVLEKAQNTSASHILQRVFSIQGPLKGGPSEDLSMAYTLLTPESLRGHLLHLMQQLQGVHEAKEELSLARDLLGRDLFDVQSLKLIAHNLDLPKTMNLESLLFQKEDADHYSVKERNIREKRIAFTRQLLRRSLEEKGSLLSKKNAHIRREIASIQSALAASLQQELQGVQKQRKAIDTELRLYIKNRREKVQAGVAYIKQRLQQIPEKLIATKKLKLSTEMNERIMSHVLEFIETKSLNERLNSIQSRPLDTAAALPKPKKASFLGFTLGGLGFGGFFGSCFLLFSGLIQGFPISPSSIRFRGYQCLGSIGGLTGSRMEDVNKVELESIRTIAGKCTPGITTLLHGNGPGYAPCVAQVLAKQGKKVVLIQLDDAAHVHGSEKGLMEFLTGKEKALPLAEHDGYKIVGIGNASSFYEERICSAEFVSLLHELTTSYSHVLLSISRPLSSELSRFCSVQGKTVIVSLRDERWSDLHMIREEVKTRCATLYFIEY